jgi:UTP--glucose-1-phosphate uridylyltransferase
MIVLNGGMATRFGGHVKGTVDALPGRSFLALHASRLLALASQLHARVPLLVMNSVATEGPTHAHIEARSGFGLPSSALRTFLQSAAPRLRADGSLYRDAHGRISLYGPGHGDLGPSLRRSGALAALREAGVEYLLMANVDNLGAWLDPALLGLFAASGKPMMAEVAPRLAGDVGGSPARVRGRLQLIEGFAFPEGFEQASIPVFNTNTLWFRLDALAVPQALHWYPVRKEADGTELLQFERLVGQLSWFVDCACVRVPRERFLPVKVAEDLAALRPQLRKLFGNSLKVLKNRDPRRNP